MLFNLSRSTTKEQITDICAGKGINIINVSLTYSIDREHIAFALVEVGTPSQVKSVKKKLTNFWLEDKKVKLKSREELGYENYHNRTLIVRNLPTHYKVKHLIKLFSNFGSPVSIELPKKNTLIEKEIQSKVDSYITERDDKRKLQTKHAQSVV